MSNTIKSQPKQLLAAPSSELRLRISRATPPSPTVLCGLPYHETPYGAAHQQSEIVAFVCLCSKISLQVFSDVRVSYSSSFQAL